MLSREAIVFAIATSSKNYWRTIPLDAIRSSTKMRWSWLICVALDEFANADATIEERLSPAEKNIALNPMRVLDLRVKLAQLADAREDVAEARKRWQRVVTLAEQTINGVGGKPLSDADFVRCAAALAKGYLANDQIPAALACI